MKSSKEVTAKKKWKRLTKEQAHALWLNRVEIRFTNGRQGRCGTWGSHYSPRNTGDNAEDDGVSHDTHNLYRFWVEVE